MDDKCKTSQMFKALCDENRVEILQLLKTGEKCACNIGEALGLAQSKLSYHMKILCDGGVVESWYVGKWTHYKLSEDGIKVAIATLADLIDEDNEKLDCSCAG